MRYFKTKCIKSLEYTQNLYILEDVDLDSVDSLIQNIPHNIKLKDAKAQCQIEAPTSGSVLLSLDHAPISKSPGSDDTPFKFYKYLQICLLLS